MMLQCLSCNAEFKQKFGELSRRRGKSKNIGKFCSLKCSVKFRKLNYVPLEPNCECRMCGKKFYRGKQRKTRSRSGIMFCSRKCKDHGQRIEHGLTEIWHGEHKDGRHAYRTAALRFYGPKCSECDFNIEPILVVHHRDGNRTNSDIRNLEVVCPNHHAIRHLLEGKIRYDKKTGLGAA